MEMKVEMEISGDMEEDNKRGVTGYSRTQSVLLRISKALTPPNTRLQLISCGSDF
jgi:hypothetical protein